MPNDRKSLMRKRARKAASRLSAREREILFLSAGEGLSNAQIAVRLEIPPEAVERSLATALLKFDLALREERRCWWKFW